MTSPSNRNPRRAQKYKDQRAGVLLNKTERQADHYKKHPNDKQKARKPCKDCKRNHKRTIFNCKRYKLKQVLAWNYREGISKVMPKV